MNREIIKQLWWEMYQPHQHEIVGGFTSVDNKEVMIFRNRKSGLSTYVYLHDNMKKLMPYFKESKLDSRCPACNTSLWDGKYWLTICPACRHDIEA